MRPHMSWVWMCDGSCDGEEVTRYEPYSDKDSQLLEENFKASGFKATTALSLQVRGSQDAQGVGAGARWAAQALARSEARPAEQRPSLLTKP